MLKKLEIKNFESHVHTVMDFSDGFNLIRGPSNSGKSAIVRALRLIAYNQFDPESVRVGTSYCEVTLTTDKGSVYVKRGKNVNHWKVTKLDGSEQEFDKIGKTTQPEIEEIVGLKTVQLGNIPLNINIMEQLERHFMMAELEGENASGSMRAQIIDEISGLSGIETLIKDVSLDNTRNAREVKQLETDAKELAKQMHNEAALIREDARLQKVETCLCDAEQKRLVAGQMKEHALAHQTANQALKDARDRLTAIPDVDTALTSLQVGSDALAMASTAQGLYDNAQEARKALVGTQERLAAIPDLDRLEKVLKQAEISAAKIADVEDFIDDCQTAQVEINLTKKNLDDAITKEEAVVSQINEILGEFEECPFCQQAIGQEQLAKMKVPAMVGSVAEKGVRKGTRKKL